MACPEFIAAKSALLGWIVPGAAMYLTVRTKLNGCEWAEGASAMSGHQHIGRMYRMCTTTCFLKIIATLRSETNGFRNLTAIGSVNRAC